MTGRSRALAEAAYALAALVAALGAAPARAEPVELARTASATAASIDTATTATATAGRALPHLDLGPLPVELEAETLRAEPTLGVYVAEGHALLRRGGLTVFADRLFLHRSTGAVVAEGHVVAVDGPAVLSCARVVLQVPGLDGAIDDAELRIKRGRAHATSAEAARDEGVDTMRLTARHLERTGPRSFALEDATFTPCRCAEGEPPDWKLGASSADVDVDRGAWLLAPVLYVRDVPVMILPVLYVPLGERRTGLLLPRADYTSAQGVALALPLYVTLGRSWDATLEAAGWLDRGPVGALELRWAPAPEQRGELRATVLFDYGERDGSGWTPGRSDPLPRYLITGRHRGRVDGLTVAADVAVAGDLDYLRELGSELADRQVEESASRLTVSTAAGDHVRVAAGLSLRQDLRPEDYGSPADRRLVHLLDPDYAIRYRFAELRIDALPYPLLGGPASPVARARLIADARGDLRDVSDVVGRVDLRPSVSLPLAAWGLSLVPELALRLTGTARGGGAPSDGRIAGLVRTQASVELHRRYGEVTHVLRPRATHLYLGLLAGEARAPADDDDELTVLGPAHQLVLALESELYLAGRSARLAALDVVVPRDLSRTLARAPLGLVRGEVSAPVPGGSLRVGGLVELDEGPVEVSEWRISAGLSLARASASVTYASLGDAPPLSRLVGGEELAYGEAIPLPTPWASFRGVVASVSATPLAALRLDATVFVDAGTPDGTRGGALRLVRGAIGWTSPCECWSAKLVVEKASDRDIPAVHLSLDLAQVGGTGL